ncbi:MAG: hypothetical protein V1818_03550 [Candidatus Aenigmatarchaeota archaeon]
MKTKTKSNLIYVLAGIVIGYMSYLLNDEFMSLGLAIVSFVLVAGLVKKAFKVEEKFKWFWSNGGWLYLFIWFITWVVFFNL